MKIYKYDDKTLYVQSDEGVTLMAPEEIQVIKQSGMICIDPKLGWIDVTTLDNKSDAKYAGIDEFLTEVEGIRISEVEILMSMPPQVIEASNTAARLQVHGVAGYTNILYGEDDLADTQGFKCDSDAVVELTDLKAKTEYKIVSISVSEDNNTTIGSMVGKIQTTPTITSDVLTVPTHQTQTGKVEDNVAVFTGTIPYYKANPSVGRTEGNRVGVIITIKNDYTKYPDFKCIIDGKDRTVAYISEVTATPGQFSYWPLVTAPGQKFYVEFKWDYNQVERFDIKISEDAKLDDESNAFDD